MIFFNGERNGRRSFFSMTKRIFRGALAVLLASGCVDSNGDTDSPEGLARAVVAALNKEDIAALHGLRVHREEYLKNILPAFPPINFSPEFAWNNLNKRSIIGVNKWIRRYGGESLSFAGIRFEKPEEPYKGLKLLRGTVLSVRTQRGKHVDLRILGSVVLRDGRYRLLSYDD